MAPIRVGLIGLSGQPADKYEGTSWTANAHLPFLKSSPDFEIVALLNTSVASAKAAIERYELPGETKAYGNPDDFAADPTIDLVVCSTRVDHHFAPVKPSVIAGKTIYVEWPLERSLAVAREMAALAKTHGARTIVGLQASFSPVIRKLKSVVESGRIGPVVSSSWTAHLGNAGAQDSKNIRYFVDRSVGGNVVSIAVGHSLEFLNYVLGDFKTFESRLFIGHPTVDIIDPANNNEIISKGVENTVPNQIKILGTVSPSNAPVSLQWRGGKAFPGVPADWQIVGQKGIVRLTSPSWAHNVSVHESKLELFDLVTGEVEILEVETDRWDELPVPAQNIARLYEAYRKGEWFPNWEWAVKRHEFLEQLWKGFDKGQ